MNLNILILIKGIIRWIIFIKVSLDVRFAR